MPDTPRSGSDFDLGDRFTGLMARLRLAPQADGVYRLLTGCYSEAGRHYHDLEHVRRCLARLDEVGELLRDADAAELALWFHDAVYDPAADDNELRSAFLFDRHLGIHLPTQRADDVHAMIMATAHAGGDRSGDALYVADIDLAGCAASWRDFLQAARLRRRECRHLTNARFEREMRGLLERLLSRPSIYLTDHFRDTCEQQARRNIEKLIHGRPWFSRA